MKPDPIRQANHNFVIGYLRSAGYGAGLTATECADLSTAMQVAQEQGMDISAALTAVQVERAKPRRRHNDPDCPACQSYHDTFHPPHDPSPNCESGGRNHCSCDTCF